MPTVKDQIRIGLRSWEETREELDGYLYRTEMRLNALDGHAGTPKFLSDIDMDGNLIRNGPSTMVPLPTDYITKGYADDHYSASAIRSDLQVSGATPLPPSSSSGTGAPNYMAKWTAGGLLIASSTMYEESTGRILLTLTSSDISGCSLIASDAIVVASAATNASLISIGLSAGNYVAVGSSKTGAGTYLPMAFFVSSAEAMRIQTTGRLLIGLTSSDVSGGSLITALALVVATAATNAEIASFSAVNGSYTAIAASKTGAGTYRPLTFWTSAAEAMRIETTGRVLIGLTSSDVSGGSLVTASTIIVASATTNAELAYLQTVAGSYAVLAAGKTGSGTYRPLTFWVNNGETARVETTGRWLVGLTSSDVSGVLTGFGVGITVASATTNAVVGSFSALSNQVAFNSGKTGSATYQPMVFNAGGAEAMRIQTNDRVAIGTSSDNGFLLEVSGTFKATTITSSAATAAHMIYSNGSNQLLGATNVIYDDSNNRILLNLTSSDVSGGQIVSNGAFVLATATTNASVGSFSVIAGNYFTMGSSKTGSGTVLPIAFFTTSVRRMDIGTSGGLIMKDGSGNDPTGGDKGAGTINIAADIYKNNTAYTNPDYVFEQIYAGKIDRFRDNPGAVDYPGPLPLDDLERFIKMNLQLPRVGHARGMFERGDVLLEKTEELTHYILQLHHRIAVLEGR